MMVSLKLAILSVIRRPKQNLAVILGITLGVSLFLGVQIGSDSLGAGLGSFTEHTLGATDAQIYPSLTPFFVTPDTITEILSGGAIMPNQTFAEQLLSTGDHLQYTKAITERLDLSVVATQPDTGSIEVGKSLKGISPNETGWGEFYNKDNKILSLDDLAPNEIYIGEDTANALFLDASPIGKTLKITTELLSLNPALAGIQSNATSIPVKIDFDVKIKDVFLDKGRGEENFADYMAMDLSVLQNIISSAFIAANTDPINHPVIGYGSKPISKVLIAWNDNLEVGKGTKIATQALNQTFTDLMTIEISPGVFTSLLAKAYVVEDTRGIVQSTIKFATDSLELLLNIFGSLIIAAGVLVIINIQNMALAARERETGIQRAIGASKDQIIWANLIESMFLGILGSLIGIGGGYLYGKLLLWFMSIAFDFNAGFIPIIITTKTIILSVLAGFIISQVTGILPAIQASRVKIAQVLRGINPPSAEHYGQRMLYLGAILTAFAILLVVTLKPNPLFVGKEAFKTLDDTKAIYLPVLFLIAGPALLVAYYRSRKLGITIVGGFAVAWAYFNILVIFNWIEEGSGGLGYILSIMLSLIVGSIILVAVNLGTIASIGQRFFSILAGDKRTSVRGTTMVAFRKMRSNVTRSTLTFALFATILTMNIFIGSWSYSFRFGYDQLVVDLSGGSHIMIDATIAVPHDLNGTTFDKQLLDKFGDTSRDVYVTDLRGFSVIPAPPGSSSITNPGGGEGTSYNFVSISNTSLWKDKNQQDWLFGFDLYDDKNTVDKQPTKFETGQDAPDAPAFSKEDGLVWKAVANNETMPNKDGVEKPVIITSIIGDIVGFSFNQTKYPGDSVFLDLKNGGKQEFVIGAISSGNPLSDYAPDVQGPPSFSPWIFVGDSWKSKLLSFSGYENTDNRYLGVTNLKNINSDKIPTLMTQIEQWANRVDGDFNTKFGSYGIVGISVWSIYASFLDGQFRFFSFLQSYVSLGFAVGILGLLVVASRSVAERKREIGMLRALGFKRRDVVVSVVLELIVMGLIGLLLGLANGLVMGYGLTNINSGGDATFLIPWALIFLYGAITVLSSIIAAIFPAINASRIPASDALRYIG